MHQVVVLFVTLTSANHAQVKPGATETASELNADLVSPEKASSDAVPPTSTSKIPREAHQKIFGRSLLLGGILGGAGGYVGFQLGQRQAQSACEPLESCTAEWLLPLSGMLLGAGAGFIFAPGYVAGQAGYRCDMDRRVLAYGGGAILGTLLVGLGLAGNDIEVIAAGLSAPWTLPTWACLESLEPIDPVEAH